MTRRSWAALPAVLALFACPTAEEPPPEPPCDPGELLDEAGDCVPERCGTSRWPAAAIEAAEADGRAVLHVAPEGQDDAEGTAGDPFDEIDDAVDAAAAAGAGLVAVAAGRYEERLLFTTVHDGIDVAGRCAELVTLDGGEAEGTQALRVSTGRVGVSGLTITGGLGGVDLTPLGAGGPEVLLTDVVIEAVSRIGVWVWEGGRAELDGCTVRDVRAWDDGGGYGFNVAGGGVLVARDTVVEETAAGSVLVFEDGEVELERVTLRKEEGGGYGLEANSGARIVARSVVVENPRGTGIVLGEPTSTADLQDVTVRNSPWGLSVSAGADLVGSGLRLEGIPDYGLAVFGTGTTVELDDVEVQAPELGDGMGIGVFVSQGATATLRDVRILGPHDVGAGAQDPGTELRLEDAVVRGPRRRFEDHGARGLDSAYQALLAVDGLLVEDVEGAGVVAMEAGVLELTGAVIRDVRDSQDGTGGQGLQVQGASSALVVDTVVEGCAGSGLNAMHSGTEVEIDGLTVRGTSEQVPVAQASGVQVQEEASLSGRRLEVDGVASVGIQFRAGATGDLEQVTVRDPRRGPDGLDGFGIRLLGGSSVALADLEVTGAHLAGLLLGEEGSSLVVDGGVVRDTTAGSDSYFGWGAIIGEGSELHATGLSLEGNLGGGLLGQQATVSLDGCTIRETLPGLVLGAGVMILGGTLAATDLQLFDNSAVGLYGLGSPYGPGQVEVEGLVSTGNEFAGVAAGSLVDMVLRGGLVSDSVPSGSAGGGGVGLLVSGSFVDLDVEDVSFVGHRGPGLYIPRPGGYRVVGCTFSDSGTAWADQPGGVLAAGGVAFWQEEGAGGLLLQDNRFEDLDGDAILLDGSGATLVDNTFEGISGEAVYRQRCDGAPGVEIEGEPVDGAPCQDLPRQVDPLLDFFFGLGEVGIDP